MEEAGGRPPCLLLKILRSRSESERAREGGLIDASAAGRLGSGRAREGGLIDASAAGRLGIGRAREGGLIDASAAGRLGIGCAPMRTHALAANSQTRGKQTQILFYFVLYNALCQSKKCLKCL